MTDNPGTPERGKPEPQAGVFATTWLVDALVLHLNPPAAAASLGIFYLVFAVFVSFMLVSALPKRALAAVLLVATPRFLIAGFAELGGPGALAGRCSAGRSRASTAPSPRKCRHRAPGRSAARFHPSWRWSKRLQISG